MSLDISNLPFALQKQMKGFADEIPKAIQKARDTVSGGSAGAKMTLWFGAADKATQIEVRDKLSKLRSYMMNQMIKCQIGANRPLDENALAEHVTGGLAGGDGINSLQRVKSGLFDGANVGILNFSPNFPNLSAYATGPVSTFDGQDQFQTVIHELTHIVLGTTDERLNGGANAYTGANARQLATESADKAKKNAENWALFVEEYR
jgi:hypothetical protein